MRLIKRGDPEETEVTCEKCKSIFAYTKEDIRITGSDKEAKHEGVICPVCGKIHGTCVTIF